MANGQTPFEKVFPALPQGFQEPFWYASLQSFWLYYRVDPELLRERLRRALPELPEHQGLEVALFDFGDGELSGLASLDLQRYTGMGPSYLETANEVEFNFYAYPKRRVPDVPLMTWQDYISGSSRPRRSAAIACTCRATTRSPSRRARASTASPSTRPCSRLLGAQPQRGAVQRLELQVYQDLGSPTPPPNPHTPVRAR